jgi:hypothetical protein
MNSEYQPVSQFGAFELHGPLDPCGRGAAILAVKVARPPAPAPRPVALRAAPGDPARRAAWLERARAAAALHHSNLARVLEVGEEGGGFVASEYLVAEDLGRIFGQRGGTVMPLEIAVNLVQQCLAGLQLAHDGASGRRPLYHGAIHPSNILLTYDGVVKLTDLATAEPRTDDGSAAALYLAPEQLDGAVPDARSDLFSLGIVLWELLTGRRLFEGPGGREASTSRPIPTPGSLRPEVPVELDAAVARALVRERMLRYPDAAEMKWGLEAAARRLTRPTPAGIGLWLRARFGAERAGLRRSIGQGGGGADLDDKLARLSDLARASEGLVEAGRPPARTRPLWGQAATDAPPAAHDTPVDTEAYPTPRGQPAYETDPQLPAMVQTGEDPPPSSPPAEEIAPVERVAAQPARRRWTRGLPWLGAGAALAAVLVASAGWFAPGRQSRRPTTTADSSTLTGGLRIESRPPGAFITVDGNPTGLSTPAVLEGLKAGRQLQIDLHLAGFQPASSDVAVRAGTVQVQAFHLHASTGTLRLANLPERAVVYADDQPLEGGPVFSLSIGRHRIRVELADDVLYVGQVEVRAGEQTVNVPRRAR